MARYSRIALCHRAIWDEPVSRDDLGALLTAATPGALVAGAHKFIAEIETADVDGSGRFDVTVPGEQRDRILRWLRQRIVRGDFGVRRAAGRTRSVAL
jgi:hypothetical protein